MILRLASVCILILALSACFSSSSETTLAQADQEYARGNYSQAEALYENYLTAFPQGEKRWQTWLKLLNIALTVYDKPGKAVSLLEAMQLEFSDDPMRAKELLWKLADVYTDLRDWEKAGDAWQKLLNLLGPGDIKRWEAYWNLGKVYQFQGRYNMSREAMMGCLEAAPNEPAKAKCMYELAQAYSFLKNKEQARTWLENIQEMEGVDPELAALSTYLLAEVVEAEGNLERARELLISIRTTYPNPMVIETRLRNME